MFFFFPELIFLICSKAILTKKPVGNILLPTDFLYSFLGSVLNNHNDEQICSWFQFNFLILMPFRKAFPCRDFRWILMLLSLFSMIFEVLTIGKTDKKKSFCLGKTDKMPPFYIRKEDKNMVKRKIDRYFARFRKKIRNFAV